MLLSHIPLYFLQIPQYFPRTPLNLVQLPLCLTQRQFHLPKYKCIYLKYYCICPKYYIICTKYDCISPQVPLYFILGTTVFFKTYHYCICHLYHCICPPPSTPIFPSNTSYTFSVIISKEHNSSFHVAGYSLTFQYEVK